MKIAKTAYTIPRKAEQKPVSRDIITLVPDEDEEVSADRLDSYSLHTVWASQEPIVEGLMGGAPKSQFQTSLRQQQTDRMNARAAAQPDNAQRAAVLAEGWDHANNRVCGLGDVASDEMILDAGPASVVALNHVLETSNTLVWNGPMGAFEMEPFDMATVKLAQTAGALTDAGTLLTVAGGGDTVAALAHAGVKDDFTHISTAGGAFLEWMEGKDLPGVVALG